MKLLRVLDRLFIYSGIVPPFVAVLAMIALMFAGTFMRYLWNRPLLFVDEFNGYLLAVIGVWGMAYVLRAGEHISVDFLVKVFPPRFAHIVETVTLIISLAMVVLLTWGTAQISIMSFASGRRSWSALETPLGPVQLILPLGFAIFAIETTIHVVRKIRGLAAGAGTPADNKARLESAAVKE